MKKRVVLCTVLIMIITIVAVALCYFGVLWPNRFFADKYSVQGIDVSNYQNDIDWIQVAKNDKIKFSYIKATEGMDYQDKYFQKNWNNISETQLYKGAYHYFKITSSGKEQAMNYINTVPVEKGCLPPVVDIEESGLNKIHFTKELRDFLDTVEERYQQKPIIYTVYPLYTEYIKGDFEEYPIWIRDIVKPAKLIDKRDWMFWQYSSRDRVKGIDAYVDFNVFDGDIEKLKLLVSN